MIIVNEEWKRLQLKRQKECYLLTVTSYFAFRAVTGYKLADCLLKKVLPLLPFLRVTSYFALWAVTSYELADC